MVLVPRLFWTIGEEPPLLIAACSFASVFVGWIYYDGLRGHDERHILDDSVMHVRTRLLRFVCCCCRVPAAEEEGKKLKFVVPVWAI